MTALGWAARIERHYRAILVASLALCLAAGWSLTRLRLDVDVLNMLPRGEPAFDDFKLFVADFGELDELFVLTDGEPTTGTVTDTDDLLDLVAVAPERDTNIPIWRVGLRRIGERCRDREIGEGDARNGSGIEPVFLHQVAGERTSETGRTRPCRKRRGEPGRVILSRNLFRRQTDNCQHHGQADNDPRDASERMRHDAFSPAET